MSRALISHSPDLKRLVDEGYHVEVVANVLVVRDVPYVGSDKTIRYGNLVSELDLAGDVTKPPSNHVAYFCGDHPCNEHGQQIQTIIHTSNRKDFGGGIVAQHSFSKKPVGKRGYDNYHHKMTTYFAIVASPALKIDPDAARATFPCVETEETNGPFEYLDTAASRAETTGLMETLSLSRVAIVGLGGTGSYILDQVSKTPVGEIHIFDGDIYSQHNAFRSPGAAGKSVVAAEPLKVDYFAEIYSKMKRGIIPHSEYIDDRNLELLADMDFVFLCIDNGEVKKPIIGWLEQSSIRFIDTGMGIEWAGDQLHGLVRVTGSTPENRGDIVRKHRVSFANSHDNLYSQNIQLADLNMLNAALAIIMWKQMMGFYLESETKRHLLFSLATCRLDGDA